MEKILTLIIPSYNMEALLPRCLDSLDLKNANNVEVIVVNDGSKDNTSNIANTYKKTYPNVVVVVDKPNGNYGSCINEGLKIATGKYVKILDADDWVDSNAFSAFVLKLETTDSDLVLTDFNHIINDKSYKIKNIGITENFVYNSNALSDTTILNIDMHAMAYRKEILVLNNYKQTEGISYTDQEWIFYPIEHVNSILYIRQNVYQYYLGREGQTMDPKVEVKKINDKVIILKRMINFYRDLSLEDQSAKKVFLKYRLMEMIKMVYKNYLLLQPDNNKINDLAEVDTLIRITMPNIYHEMNGYVLHNIFPYKYIKRWRKTKKATPKTIKSLNKHLKDIQVFVKKILLK